MPEKRILYVSDSVGLGHITRDLAIARALREQDPGVRISWLASHPASLALKLAGEELVREADQYADVTLPAERTANSTRLNLMRYLVAARQAWLHNVEIFQGVMRGKRFDLVIGDESYAVDLALKADPHHLDVPFVMILDFVGLDSATGNPVEKLGVYICNAVWARDYQRSNNPTYLGLYIGELEDVPNKRFGCLLPHRRDYAKRKYQFIGYVFDFDPADYADQSKTRAKLGYGQEPLIVCTIGGTSIGKELLELCGRAYPIIKQKIPDLRMVLVCGPRLGPDSLQVPSQVERKAYVPALYEHLAASDLAIVQAGGTTTLELTALRRPFLYFPLEHHFEQQIHVAERLARHGAGVKMVYSQTTPASLAEQVIAQLGRRITYAPIPSDGAQRAAQLIGQLL
jgi:UDP-N-acetylglucosamine:LPS N-acetylglucosamine transferase